jgi:hypothetical protein
MVSDKCDCITVLLQNISVCLFKYIILCSVLYFSLGKVTRGGENTGINREKDLFAVGVCFPTGTEGYLPQHCPGTS